MKKLMVILAAGIAVLMVDAAPPKQGPQQHPQVYSLLSKREEKKWALMHNA